QDDVLTANPEIPVVALFEHTDEPTPNLDEAFASQTRRLQVIDNPSYLLPYSEAQRREFDSRTPSVAPENLADYERLFGIPIVPEDDGRTRELQISDFSSYADSVLRSRPDQTINA